MASLGRRNGGDGFVSLSSYSSLPRAAIIMSDYLLRPVIHKEWRWLVYFLSWPVRARYVVFPPFSEGVLSSLTVPVSIHKVRRKMFRCLDDVILAIVSIPVYNKF